MGNSPKSLSFSAKFTYVCLYKRDFPALPGYKHTYLTYAFKLRVHAECKSTYRNPLSFCSSFEAGVFFSGLGLPSKTSSFPDPPPPPSLSQPPGSERPWRANFWARARVDSSILSWTSGSQPSAPSVAGLSQCFVLFLHCWICSVLTSFFLEYSIQKLAYVVMKLSTYNLKVVSFI